MFVVVLCPAIIAIITRLKAIKVHIKMIRDRFKVVIINNGPPIRIVRKTSKPPML